MRARAYLRDDEAKVVEELCPDCQHPEMAHATNSRVVGCQWTGEEEGMLVICGCRRLRGEPEGWDQPKPKVAGPTTEELCAEIERLDAAATPLTEGPWMFEPHGETVALYAGRAKGWHGLRLFNVDDGDTYFEANLELIASFRTLAPELARRAREMQERIAVLEELLDSHR